MTPHSTMLDSVAIGASAFLIVLTSVLLVGCTPDFSLAKQPVDLFTNCGAQNFPAGLCLVASLRVQTKAAVA